MNKLQMLKKAMLAYVSAVKFVWSAIAYPLSIVGKKLMNLRGYRVYGNSYQCPVGGKNFFNVNNASKFSGFSTFSVSDGVITASQTNTSSYQSANVIISEYLIGKKVTISAKVKTSGENKGCIRIMWMDGSTAINSSMISSHYSGETENAISATGYILKRPSNPNAKLCIAFYSNTEGTLLTGTTYTAEYSDIQIEIGDTATEYEPYIPAPSPEYPSEIESVGDYDAETGKYKIPVVARGRNLLPTPTFGTFTQNGVTFTNNKDGTITINGTPTAYTATPNMYLPNSTLEVLRNNVCVLTGFHYYEKNIALVLAIGLNGNWIKYIYLNPYTYQNYVKVNLTNVEFDKVVFAVRCQSNGILIDNLTVKPLLEVGTTMPTSFEPYIAPVTTNIYLNEPLRKVGDYADYIDFEKQKVVRNVEVLDDTGTKTIDESLGVINPPIEEAVKLPALPQFKGTTIYEVGTSIKPSGMEAKYC